IGKGEVAELAGAQVNELFTEPADMHADEGTCVECIESEIAIGNGIHRITTDAAEPELGSHGFTIERIGCTCKCSAPERKYIGPVIRLADPLQVAQKHLAIGVHVM